MGGAGGWSRAVMTMRARRRHRVRALTHHRIALKAHVSTAGAHSRSLRLGTLASVNTSMSPTPSVDVA
jgi:hypothetical protein